MHIELKGVSKTYGSFKAVDNVSFAIERGKLIGLLGPSGGGKSTLLRILAGLETPDSGEIRINGKRVNDVAPQERGIGFVFQNYALFKHMSVYDNIAFGLTIRKASKAEIKSRVDELLELTGLRGFEKRYPHQLSGGQRQRVAFARALAPRPDLLLLDEPFAAIDAKVRKELRTWLKQLIATIGITSIFVTHDQDEAVEVADEMLIVQQGKLEQQGTPVEVYTQPKSAFVASFVGHSTIIDDPAGLHGFDQAAIPAGAKGIIRPDFVEAGRADEISLPSAAAKGTVKRVFFRGTHLELELTVRANRLIANRSLDQPPLQPGDEVSVLIHRIYVLAEQSAVMVENPLKLDPLPVHI
ncbi:sulfate transport system ATP-binding protein [Paenibacillus phyllosphaerae]|uniref:Carnitine transport ATP-binding protein OpuCA n=1 Tax=Paenibacillus phyllosphaerae TaxID=274593 RepID=A0A7W5FKY5_9BACL|nr:ABC transporter ATP-binding protein [Paenibacillus phyllosphaerae]MBB3108402.1 sulfate transport system ATP-binding protein [Paenibacillus phyllosphaerae]